MMKSQAWWLMFGFLVVYAMTGPVQAGAVVELRLADLTGAPIGFPPGGYYAGDQFLVELWLKPDQDIVVREMTIDYRGSDPAAQAAFGLDIDTVNQPIDGVPNFWFDYTGAGFGTYPADGLKSVEVAPGVFFDVSTTADYSDFSNLISSNPSAPVPVPVATVTTNSSANGNLITYTGGVFNRVGGMPFTVPSNRQLEGFTVDLLGSPDGGIDDRNNGSSITFGFGGDDDPVTIWANATDDSTVDGSLTYAPGAGPIIVAQIIPEPTTILLFVGGFCLILQNVRRRNSYA